VFEHFDRPTALRLLVNWRTWLRPGGVLRIETPDFERCVREFALRRLFKRRTGVVLRHLFGSHEAAWAVHWDGWYEQRYRDTLGALGFVDPKFERARWKGTHNITVTARAGASPPDRATLMRVAEGLLRDSLVDTSESELRLLDHWIRQLRGGASPS
jgi:hypothetical protein